MLEQGLKMKAITWTPCLLQHAKGSCASCQRTVSSSNEKHSLYILLAPPGPNAMKVRTAGRTYHMGVDARHTSSERAGSTAYSVFIAHKGGQKPVIYVVVGRRSGLRSCQRAPVSIPLYRTPKMY